ncbi:T9SS type A sorting domain-containing protein [Dyadobacter arcticus]|uniref:FlaG/FlaF family flagellin (Archaellin) n=1 Tax=Dyadobacter arcticus TaxID=1078754 RepID=A0ABX0UPU3_9BACT|nr:T9SS type A sorting domain-containing protein [Dyadobacter arcticus]NIJ53979.1 FlaG/FlaF family flagellin (archaellin) [Dyadobacter arcticus]
MRSTFTFLLLVFTSISGFAQIDIKFPPSRMVFQRNTEGNANVFITGTYTAAIDKVEARLKNRPGEPGVEVNWTQISGSVSGNVFSGSVIATGGRYDLEVRGMKDGKQVGATANVEKVGVGEVFLIVGHSNAEAANSPMTGAGSDLVNSINIRSDDALHEKYLRSGKPEDLPALLPSQLCQTCGIAPMAGYPWLWSKLGDLLVSPGALNVPVLFYSAAFGGSSMDQTYKAAYDIPFDHGFINFNIRMPYVNIRNTLSKYAPQTGLRAILSMHGVNDQDTDGEGFKFRNQKVIEKTREESFFSKLAWMVATSCYNKGVNLSITSGQESLIATVPNVFRGANLNSIDDSGRYDGLHFNENGQQRAAELWRDAITNVSTNILKNAEPLMAKVPPLPVPPVSANCDFNIAASPSNATPTCSASFNLTAECSGADCAAVTYQWSGNGINLSGKSVNVNAPTANGSFSYTVTASKAGCNPKTASASITVTSCQPPTTGQPISICLEAENSNGSGPISGDPNASGGLTRGDQNNYNHYVDYAVNGVPSSGQYQLKLLYFASSNARATISSNGNTIISSVTFPATGSWNIVNREETINVTLSQGNNVIRIQGLPGVSLRQDRICVTGQGSGNPQPVTCNFAIAPSANAQSYKPNVSMTLNANCSGADCASVSYKWTGNGANVSGSSANINAPATPGDYTYTLSASKAGCADKTSNVIVHIVADGPTPATCDFNVSANPSNATPACSASFSLTAECSGADCNAITYQWSGNGINLSGKSVNVNAPAANGSFSYTVTASKAGCNPKTASASINVNSCQPPTTGQPISVCLEAENSNGNGPISGDPNASGGLTRGDQNNYNHYVDYSVNGVPSAGTYKLKILYYANDNARVAISSNGNTIISSVTLPATSSWNIVNREETINVTLSQGNNVIRIQGLPGAPVRQDRICVTGQGSGNPQPITCNYAIAPSANAQSYKPQQTIALAANCSGADCGGATFKWTGNTINYTGANVSINAPVTPGDYTYTLTASKAGCADKTSNLVVRVVADDPTPATCNFNVTASRSNATPACSATFSLTADCSGADCAAVAYQWSGNGINLSGKSVNANAPAANGSFSYTVTASKAGCSPKTASAAITVTSCQPPTTGQPISICQEAENSNGNGPISSDPNASGGRTRGDQNNYNHYVDYAVNGVPSAGNYQLKLVYYSNEDAFISISSNGNVIKPSVKLPSTHSWNIVNREETINVTLSQGNNIVRIQGLPGFAVRQDKICVTGNGQTNIRTAAPELAVKDGNTFKEALRVFPNPSSSDFEVNFNISTGNETTINVTDLHGKNWFTQKLKGKGDHHEKIRISDAPAGIYLLQIKNGNQIETKKLLLIK